MIKIIVLCLSKNEIITACCLEKYGNFDIKFLIPKSYIKDKWDQEIHDVIKNKFTVCKDRDEILKEVERAISDLDYHYIYPLFPDTFVEAIGEINERYDLPGIKSRAAKFLNNKSKYYSIWKELGISHPIVYAEIPAFCEITHISKDIVFPCIVKPSSGFSSLGVQIIENKKDLLNFFKDVDRQTHQHQEKHKDKFKNIQYLSMGNSYLVQEYIDGSIISVTGMIKNHKIDIDLIYEIETDCYPYAAETGFKYPTEYDKNEFRKKITEDMYKFFKYIDLNDSPFMLDIVVKNNKLYYIDFAARLSAITFNLFIKTNEIDFSTKVVNKILLDKDYRINLNPFVWRKIPLRNGLLKRIEFPDAQLADLIDYPESSQIMLTRNDFAVAHNGKILVTGNSIEEVENKFFKITNSMVVEYFN